MQTDYHAQYYAHELTRRYPSDRMVKLSRSLFNAHCWPPDSASKKDLTSLSYMLTSC